LQKALIKVFRCPGGRLIDNLSQINGQFYSIYGPVLLGNEVGIKTLSKLVSKDLTLMKD